MKNTLIIPDLHLNWQGAQKIIESVKAEQIIFLGDFFDQFNDTPEAIGEMADWLEAEVRKPNRIFLYGNHDVHYAYAARHLQCSGYAEWKYFLIHDNYDGKKVWDHFQWYYILDGKWLLSHAGLHTNFLPTKVSDLYKDRPKFLSELDAYLTAESHKAFRTESWFTQAGYSRGGSQKVGGLTWCDFQQEFFPILGLNQVVGHTPQRHEIAQWCYWNGKSAYLDYNPVNNWTVKAEDLDDVERSYNLDLDVWKNLHWGVWNGKTLEVFNERDDL